MHTTTAGLHMPEMVSNAQARNTDAANTPRLWMKSAIVEREAGDQQAERTMLEQGITRFPTFPKLYLMLGQLEERCGNTGLQPQQWLACTWAVACAAPAVCVLHPSGRVFEGTKQPASSCSTADADRTQVHASAHYAPC